jgi:UDP-perosamine 4-acetyltransferase
MIVRLAIMFTSQPAARLSGGVIVHEGAHIGLGAIIRQRIKIGREAIVGAGAVVVKDVAPGTTVIGVRQSS